VPSNITLDAIVAEVAQRREEFDHLCHVPRDMIEKMIGAGIFRSSVPKRFGGAAVPPHEFLPIVERISEADGSAGWVAGFGSASVYLAALPAETQAIIYKDGPDQVFGGGLYPPLTTALVHCLPAFRPEPRIPDTCAPTFGYDTAPRP
jgi:alkylation response protein AidB-like acyl-CoA dehydrogenase